MRPKSIIALILPVVFLFCIYQCSNTKNSLNSEVTYLNLNDTVKYVGMQTCRSCHASIYDTYIKTGMGQSFDDATKAKSAASFGEHSVVYDSINDFYYRPLWIRDSLYVHEYRVEEGDTTHSRLEHINYVVGSGQHTNSHICNFNGYLYQAPITYYTQSGRWDLAPGFEGGFNSRFSRIIGHECLTCHNALPGFESNSQNKYHTIPKGIDCERCHGPGEIHVREKLAGIIVDTAKEPDYTIVNPRRLNNDLQMSLCQRCHLQGLAVLQEGKAFDDFRPGMHLSEVLNVFLPKFEGTDNAFIMASQAERLRMSACFKSSEMSCITCHDPHISVRQTPIAQFNKACIHCHSGNKVQCAEDKLTREAVEDNCSGCHMPKSGSIDIPHVFITDHYIRRHEGIPQKIDPKEVDKIEGFIGLQCLTDDNPDKLTMARAYLSFYEKFSQRPYLLDSAKKFLVSEMENEKKIKPLVHLYYLQGDFEKLVKSLDGVSLDNIKDDWTYYRIGEAHFQLQQFQLAQNFYQKAVDISPLNLEFQNKLAASLVSLAKYEEARAIYEFILVEQPDFTSALSNLGYLYMLAGSYQRAGALLDKAIGLDPDYELALLNKAAILIQNKEYDQARKIAYKILRKDKENEKAQMMLKALEEI